MNWFIIQGKDHLGPFSIDFIEKMYADGQLNDQSLLWFEGLDEPDTYHNLVVLKPEQRQFHPLFELLEPEKSEEEDAPPKLPPLPVEKKPVLKEVSQPKSKSQKPVIREQIPTSKENKSLTPYLIVVLLLIFLIGIPTISYINLTTLFARPAKMGNRDYENLVMAATRKGSKDTFAMAMAKDKTALWVATNNFNYGRVGLNIKSLPGKILGEGTIEATAIGHLEKRFAAFDRFNFLEGSRLIDGYYQVEFYTLGPLQTPWLKTWDNEEKEFKYFAEILISSMPKEKFDKALHEMIQVQVANENNYWEELNQKYQTLKAITSQIRESLENIFTNPSNWAQSVTNFENDYKMNYGQFFTNFVISNDASYNELATQTFADKVEVIASYTRLSRLAKTVGSHSMEILHELESFKNVVDQPQLQDLRQRSLGKLDSIINECDQKIAATEGR